MSAAGRTFVLVGHPVGHSLSPTIHDAAYRALGLSGHRYLARDCPDEAAVRREVEALRRGETAGANVTVPWKRLALDLADEAHASARDVGAANVLTPVREGDRTKIVAHNTDVGALADELAAHGSGTEAALVVGNGGAARAAVAACRSLGIARVFVVARRFRGSRSADWDVDSLEQLGATPVAWPDDPSTDSPFRRAAASSRIVVQSTSDGMRGASDGTAVRDLVPWAALAAGTFAYDLVYNPAVTLFVAAARAHGLPAESGLGMLVGQAARAVELWLGVRPDSGPLRSAAARALAEKFPA